MSEAVWRDGGVIHFAVPSEVVADTFLVLAPAHSNWVCFVMEDMSQVLEVGDMKPEVRDTFHLDFEAMREGMRKGHNTAEHESRLKRGTEDYLSGLIYGTMQPTELSAMADDLDGILSVFVMSDNSETGKGLIASWSMWLEAARKFVLPHEGIAPNMVRTVKE